MIELLSTDPKAPTKAAQRKAIRRDGTVPDRAIEVPENYDLLPLALRPNEDMICIAHPRVLGNARLASAVLGAMGRAGTLLKFPGETAVSLDDDATRRDILARVVSTPWDVMEAKGPRGRGRPPKRRQPTDGQKEELRIYWTARDEKDPDKLKYQRHVVLSLAQSFLGRKVMAWELNEWLGPRKPKEK